MKPTNSKKSSSLSRRGEKSFALLSSLLLLLSLFLVFLKPNTDADLGWHLRYGDHFLNTGQILRQNTFSTQMSNYSWPNHSWGYDVIISSIYKYSGFTALSIFATLLITISIFIFLRRQLHISSLILIPLIYFGTTLFYTGAKSQLVSFILTAFMFYLLYYQPKIKKFKLIYLIPLITLVWANTHGQFLLGLATLAIWTIFYIPKKDQLSKKTLLILTAISTLTIFINPFGAQILNISSGHFNANALANVYEWMPWKWGTPRMYALLAYMTVIWIFIAKNFKSINRSYFWILLAYTFFALKARRIIPFFLLISIPIVQNFILSAVGAKNLSPTKHKKLIITNALILALIFIFFLRQHLTNPITFDQSWDSYCQSNIMCSEPLIEFMNQNQIEGKIFNSYRLGGWLIYRYPQNKVFIDGRMTLWKNSQGQSPFLKYLEMVHTKANSKELFDLEQFDYVIIHPQSSLHKALTQIEHWPAIYSDDTLELLINPSSTPSAQTQN